jgi:hypothetical protein
MSYSELKPAPIRSTAELLARRIEERFPASGLSRVADEMLRLVEHNEQVVLQLRRPLWWLRVLSAAAILALLLLTAWGTGAIWRMAAGGVGGVSEVLEAIDAATSELILLGLTVFFFASLETRLKRRTALRMLHRLRSIAHVVDMHQLTKDPEHVLARVEDTPSSPTRDLSHGELARYLDYCSELLALTSKLAALHAQHLQDPVVLNAVNDIESLTEGLSRKVWQKITILDVAAARAGSAASN